MKKEPNPKPTEEEPEGYPTHPKSEDIYYQYKEEQDIDPEDITRKKETDLQQDLDEDESLDEDIMGTDLDVPGAELDDDLEEIGNEDEENNYYSIGGDNHNNLEEDQGDGDLEI